MCGLRLFACVAIFILVSAVTSPAILAQDVRSNFLAESSRHIARLLFERSVENETNYIFSPFGYSMILGILSEATGGETREELRRILHSPQNTTLTRQNFKDTLRRLQETGTGAAAAPQFRTYFYVYENASVASEFKTILSENYQTQVRRVNRLTCRNDAGVWRPTADSVAMDAAIESRPRRDVRSTVVRERIKRWAKRFVGVDLDAPHNEGMRTSDSKNVSECESHSQLIVFNGLYFDGAWETPFLTEHGAEPFYTADGRNVTAKMMSAVGHFRIGRIGRLDSTAICLPYKGERYSFLILYPDTGNGTGELIRRMKNVELTDVCSRLESRHLRISLPAFEFDATSYLKESLNTIGIEKVFANGADLSGLSDDKGLFVDDVVQLVRIKANEEAAAPNFLTASSLQTRTVTEKFRLDHPFVFLVLDHRDELIIAAGKLYSPTKDEERSR